MTLAERELLETIAHVVCMQSSMAFRKQIMRALDKMLSEPLLSELLEQTLIEADNGE